MIWVGFNSVLINGIDYVKWMNFYFNDGKDKLGFFLLNVKLFVYFYVLYNLIILMGRYFW